MKDQLKDLVLLLPQEYKNLKYVSASFEAFWPGRRRVHQSRQVLSCERLLVPTQTASSGHYNDELIREVGKLMVGFYANESRETPADRVYISRALAPKRKILNEEEVIEVLRAYDFRIVRTEDHSFAEQVKIAARAHYVVTNRGAGLTNMLFMHSGTSVLELRHATDRINNCYFTLASRFISTTSIRVASQRTPPKIRTSPTCAWTSAHSTQISS